MSRLTQHLLFQLWMMKGQICEGEKDTYEARQAYRNGVSFCAVLFYFLLFSDFCCRTPLNKKRATERSILLNFWHMLCQPERELG